VSTAQESRKNRIRARPGGCGLGKASGEAPTLRAIRHQRNLCLIQGSFFLHGRLRRRLIRIFY